MKFITPGEKIKKTRKYLKMKQQDLQDKNVSRGLISMIEIGQRTLNKDIATNIIQKFSKRSEELGIKLELDVEYFLRTPNEDAELYYLKKLKHVLSLDDIQSVLDMADKFNLLNISAAAYSKLGDYFLDSQEYQNSFTNYTNSVNIYKELNESTALAYLYWKTGLCKALMLDYTEAILYFNSSKQYSLLYEDIKIQKSSFYNLAKCYKKVNNISLALENINIFLSLCNKNEDFNYYIYANILKANCYEIEGNIDAVISLYTFLLSEFQDDNSHLLGYIYNNLGLAYLHKCNFEKSKKYFEIAEKIRNDVDHPLLSQTLIEKANLFIKQGIYNDAIISIKLGLSNAKIYKNFEDLLKGNYMLADIYITTNDHSSLKNTYFIICDLLKEINNIPELICVYNKLSILYLDENNISKAKEFLLMSVELCGNSFKYSL